MCLTISLFSTFPIDVVASGTCGANLVWEVDDNDTLIISGAGSMTNYSYTDSPGWWYSHRHSIKNIIIEDGVLTIGSWAFLECENLTSVTIGNSVTTIGASAFWDCSSLISVTIPNSVTTIGEWAFQGCSSLTNIIISDSVTQICDYAFTYCNNLTSITIGKGVTSIGEFAFYDCNNLSDVYYCGSREDWAAISIGSANNTLTNATIHYDSIIRYDDDDGVSINGKGYAYLRYTLNDTDGNPLVNTRVDYSIDGYDTLGGSLWTDENGGVCIRTPDLAESQDLTIRFTSPYGTEIADSVKTEHIIVEPLSFKQTWKGQVGATGEVGASAGIGANAGVVEAEGAIASASLSGGLSGALALENSYAAGERKLKISSTIGSEVASKVSAGLWASGSILSELEAEVSPVNIYSNQSVASDYTKSAVIENYDPTNPEHLAKIVVFLVDSASNNNNVIAQIMYKILNTDPHNEESVKQITKMSGGANVGQIKVSKGDLELGEFTILSIGPSSTYTMSSTKDLDDGSFTFGNGLATSFGYDLISLELGGYKKKNKDDPDSSNGVSASKGMSLWWGDFIDNNVEFESKVTSGEFTKFTVKALEEEENSGILTQKTSSIEKSVIYSGSQAEKIAESDAQLTSLALGEIGLLNPQTLAEVLTKITAANADGSYKRDKKYHQVFDLSVGAGLTALVKFGLDFDLKGIYSDQFTYENGTITNNTEYIQSVSTADAEFEDAKMTLDEIFAEAYNYIASVIEENIQTFTGKVKEGVEALGATVKGAFDYVVDVMFIEVPQVQSFSVLAVSEEEDLFDTSSVATTVGNPYIINVKDNNGNEIADFADTPLQLTLEYTADDLSTAEINNTAEDLDNLKIYWYNKETGVFVYVGGELDYENSSVTADITKSGQYILAIDNCAPSVTDFKVTNETSTPTFKATVADMSGIQDFSFKIDGKEFVNDSNLSKFYSSSSALFEYQATEPLESGEHTATITASDSAGNVMVNSVTLTFNVDTDAPVIENLNISDKIYNGKINISANVTDANLNSVKAYVQNEDGIYTYDLEETDGIWSAEIEIPQDTTLTVWVSAYDCAGNSTDSEKKQINIRSTTLEILDKYQGEFTATMEETSSSVSIRTIGNIPETMMIVAEYGSNNELVKVQVINGVKNDTGADFIAELPESDNYKIMLWDKNSMPIIKSVTE